MKNFNTEGIVDAILKHEKAKGIVVSMKPLDMVHVFVKKLDLHPKDASKMAIDLIRKLHSKKTDKEEGLSGNSIETNMQYPVPPALKKEDGNFIDITPKLTWRKSQEIPQPRDRPEGWPYDKMTVAIMDPHAKSGKRGLKTGKTKKGKVVKELEKQKFKGPLEPDLRFNQAGGSMGGTGIHSRNAPHNRDNSTSSSGASWSKMGSPGWSSSPPGKEFDQPDDMPPESLPKPASPPSQDWSVGSGVPNLGDGGRNPGRRLGFRRR